MGVPPAQRAGFWGGRERSERGFRCRRRTFWGDLASFCLKTHHFEAWMLMTTIWHNITFTKRFKAHVLLRLMGDFVCSNGRGD
eukprot:6031428-Prymnesium_polylepis.1